MSDPGEQDPAPGGPGGVGEEASQDPRPLLGVPVPVEWLVEMAGAVGLLAFQLIIRNCEEDDEQEAAAQATCDKNQDIPPIEEKDEEKKEGKEEDSEEKGEAAGASFSEYKVPDAKIGYKVECFCHNAVTPKSLSLLTKEALLRYYKSFYKEAQEGGGKEKEEEESKSEELEGLEKHL